MTEPPCPGLSPGALTPDPWIGLAALTPARLALGRAGSSLPTREVLKLGLAQARARDAVHASLPGERIAAALAALGLAVIQVESAAQDRPTYLRRPDLGRRLSEASRARLAETTGAADVAIVIADGLSASAIDANALPLVEALLPRFAKAGLSVGPVAIATQARVALGDEIGALLRARIVVVLIGERPGLSSADSLGAYLTFSPRPGRTDAERNCVSNIRDGGLPAARAAGTIGWLVRHALALSLTGVALKDESEGLPAPDPVRNRVAR